MQKVAMKAHRAHPDNLNTVSLLCLSTYRRQRHLPRLVGHLCRLEAHQLDVSVWRGLLKQG